MAKYLIASSEFKRALKLDAAAFTPLTVIELMEGREPADGILEALGINPGIFKIMKYEPNLVSILGSLKSVHRVVVYDVPIGFDWGGCGLDLRRFSFPVVMLVDRLSLDATPEARHSHPAMKSSDLFFQYFDELNRFDCLKHRGVPTIAGHYCFGHQKTLVD